ncbi:hypothetical protein [Polaribacter aquimarinus]|uniref:Uncharacterized protein n=1 Tax=Polaribacter aquimarinus TaxID=2100726 RepID=A0A2U2J9V3_9FLAO|nr:hypothetical protein [Polaribacter aquimarinus]PWG05119.1 hypothetical protein DIS07_07680 [Polaribacter aquimarinus]
MKEKIKNSELYLDSVLGKKSGFSTSKDYFDDVEEHFFIALAENAIPKKDAFSTPTSYFNNLEDSILDSLKSEKKNIKVISLKQKFYKIIPAAIAASIALFISINYFNKENIETRFDNLAETDIETWFLENSSSITSEDIATFVSVDNMNMNDFAYTNIDNDLIEDYIIYNDNTTLLNEIN